MLTPCFNDGLIHAALISNTSSNINFMHVALKSRPQEAQCFSRKLRHISVDRQEETEEPARVLSVLKSRLPVCKEWFNSYKVCHCQRHNWQLMELQDTGFHVVWQRQL